MKCVVTTDIKFHPKGHYGYFHIDGNQEVKVETIGTITQGPYLLPNQEDLTRQGERVDINFGTFLVLQVPVTHIEIL